MSEPRPLGAIEESIFDLIAADLTCLARIADAQGMTPEVEAIANSFDANFAATRVRGRRLLFSKMRRCVRRRLCRCRVHIEGPAFRRPMRLFILARSLVLW
jgi:hypothetical protein